MGADEHVQRLVGELLIALGVHVTNGSVTLHVGDRKLMQVETKTFRKFNAGQVALRRPA